MGKNCAVPGCISKRRSQDAVHLFSFPTRSKALMRQWMRSIPRKDFQPSKHSRMCSLHCSPDDFCKDSMDTNPRRLLTSSNHKPRLKANAVPIYADLPRSLKAPKERPDSATSTTTELRQKQDIERKEREIVLKILFLLWQTWLLDY